MKEWKGNSDSVRSRLAINKAHTTKGREVDDFYATDPAAIDKLLDNCSDYLCAYFKDVQFMNYCIWECACGNGNLVYALRNRGYAVLATDIKDRGCKGLSGVDFLKTDPIKFFTRHREPHIILTNPPYSLANEFILHALDILPEGGLYIALMNINCLAGIERYNKIFSKGSLREIYVFSKRIGCWKNNERDDKKAHIINYAWYVFQKGYKGQPTLYWL